MIFYNKELVFVDQNGYKNLSMLGQDTENIGIRLKSIDVVFLNLLLKIEIYYKIYNLFRLYIQIF